MRRTSVSCKDIGRLITFAHNHMRLLNSRQTLGEVLDEIENEKGGDNIMKCKNCGHDVEALDVDRTTVQTVMDKNPCCEEPDYRREATEEDMFEYLDKLQDRGVVNMFGATAYLVVEFHLTKGEATKILGEWMRTFSERHPG